MDMTELATLPPVAGGVTEGLSFELAWESEITGPTAADCTWGGLRLMVDGQVVWGSERDRVRWTWVELLEFLAGVWPYLVLEEGFPPGLAPGDPELQVRRWTDERERRRDEGSLASQNDDSDRVQEFRETHDLSSSVGGLLIPPIWIVREGSGCWVCSGRATVFRDITEVLAALERLATQICDRLGGTGDERGRLALAEWASRLDIEPESRGAIATSLDEERLDALRGDANVVDHWEVADVGSVESTELMAVARMAGQASTAELSTLLAEVRAAERRPTNQLDELAAIASDEVAPTVASRRPYEQGCALAAWLRDRLGLTLHDRFDPDAQLEAWGVEVRTVTLEASAIDAVGCWGERHGPVVIVNRHGPHAGSPKSRRATLAHEIVHLLIDRATALPLAEVLGGAVTLPLEQRARAFAAEVLLPRAIAGTRMSGGAAAPARAVKQLADDYGASREIVAWQALNSDEPLPEQIARYLRSSVRRTGGY